MEKVADAFVEKLLAKAKKLKAGDPMDPATDVGTVIHEGAAKQFEARVADAVSKGAKLLHGGQREGALYIIRRSSITCPTVASSCMRRPSARSSPSSAAPTTSRR